MIRRLCQKQFVLQSQTLLLNQPKERVFQSKPFSYFTTSFIAPVRKNQQLNYSKNRCDEKSSGENCNDEVSPVVLELQKRLQCTKSEAAEVYELLSTNSDGFQLETINKTLKFLNRIGASMFVIVRNCHILLVPLGKSFKKKKKNFEEIKSQFNRVFLSLNRSLETET